MLYREIRRSHLLALLIDKKFKPIHDRIHNPAIAAVIRGIDEPAGAQAGGQGLPRVLPAAALPRVRRPRTRPTTNAQEHDPRLLADHLRDAAAAGLPGAAGAARPLTPGRAASTQLYDSFVYCLPLELKKVINTELLDISVARQAGHRARAGREQPRHPEGLLPAVGGAAGAGLRPRGAGAATSSRTSRPSSSSRVELRDSLAAPDPRRARLPGGRRTSRAAVRMKEEISPLLRPQHEVPDVPRLVGLRAVLHRDPEVHEPARAAADRPPLRDLPHDPVPRGAEALDPAARPGQSEPVARRDPARTGVEPS